MPGCFTDCNKHAATIAMHCSGGEAGTVAFRSHNGYKSYFVGIIENHKLYMHDKCLGDELYTTRSPLLQVKGRI